MYNSREVGDGEERIRIEDVGFEESLQQVPRHWAMLGSEQTARDEAECDCDGGGASFRGGLKALKIQPVSHGSRSGDKRQRQRQRLALWTVCCSGSEGAHAIRKRRRKEEAK